MKRLLTILACLLLSSSAHADESMQLAWMNPAVLGSGGGACSQSTIFEQTTNATLAGVARTGRNYCATYFTVSGTGEYIVKRVSIYWKKVGTPTSCNAGVVTINPVVSSSCDESNPIATADSTFNIASLSTDLNWDGFNFTSGATLTKGTKYCLLVYCASVESSGTDINVAFNNDVAYHAVEYSADGTTWTVTDASGQWNIKLETCTE